MPRLPRDRTPVPFCTVGPRARRRRWQASDLDGPAFAVVAVGRFPARAGPASAWHVSDSETWRRGSESNRRIEVLQTSALPLGYRAVPQERRTLQEKDSPRKPRNSAGNSPTFSMGRAHSPEGRRNPPWSITPGYLGRSSGRPCAKKEAVMRRPPFCAAGIRRQVFMMCRPAGRLAPAFFAGRFFAAVNRAPLLFAIVDFLVDAQADQLAVANSTSTRRSRRVCASPNVPVLMRWAGTVTP